MERQATLTPCHPELVSGSCHRYIIPTKEKTNNIPFASRTAQRHVRGDYVPQKESETEWLSKQLCHPELVSGSCHRNIIPSPENINNIPSASRTVQRHVRGDYVPQKESKTGWLAKILGHRDLGSITESLINHRHIEPLTEGLLLCKYSEQTFLHNREKSKANVREGSERDSEQKSGNAEAFQSIKRSNQRHKVLKINSKFFFFGSLFLFSCPKKEKVNKEQTISKVLSNKLKRQVRGGCVPRKAAFTLAEVLITLGIIGVVAALTLPALINNSRNKELEAGLKKNYSIIQQAFDMYQAQNGERLRPQNVGLHEFKSLIMPYFKVLIDCGFGYEGGSLDPECGAVNSSSQDNKVTNYMTFNNNSISMDYFDDGQFILSDGSVIFIENRGNAYGNLILISVDVNGPSKRPNKWGQDLFTFQLTDDGKILPMGAGGTKFTDLDIYCSNNSSSQLNGIACAYSALTDKNYWQNLP